MESLKCLFCNFPWDIFLFALLLGLLLWWLLSMFACNKYKRVIDELKDRVNFLEGELEACRKSKVTASVAATGSASAVGSAKVGTASAVGTGIAGVTSAAGISSLADAKSSKDDLKVVEGIGPKIEELCNNSGIFTFAQLANTPASKIKDILVAAGSKFQMHDPTTWPAQAELARDGKWDELKKWQDELNKGKA